MRAGAQRLPGLLADFVSTRDSLFDRTVAKLFKTATVTERYVND